ncbi:MAG: ABC transporter permease [Desulfatibacillaceae bacterium]|nr:ABC transporter permease [Desulfatibacillaceae bacterium]
MDKEPYAQVQVVSAQQAGMAAYLNPLVAARDIFASRRLLFLLVRRAVLRRYKGSFLGLLWSLATPLAMLLVYTFVFSFVFKAQWEPGQGHAHFALALFTGLIAFLWVSESLTAACNCLVEHRTHIHNTRFPIQVLPLAALGPPLADFLVSLAVLAAAQLFILGRLPITFLWLPVIYLAILPAVAGLVFFLAFAGVFVRDLSHALKIAFQVLLFATPVFYPISLLPENFRGLMAANPMHWVVSFFRDAALWGKNPSLVSLIVFAAAGICLFMAGYALFMSKRREIADYL